MGYEFGLQRFFVGSPIFHFKKCLNFIFCISPWKFHNYTTILTFKIFFFLTADNVLKGTQMNDVFTMQIRSSQLGTDDILKSHLYLLFSYIEEECFFLLFWTFLVLKSLWSEDQEKSVSDNVTTWHEHCKEKCIFFHCFLCGFIKYN